MKSFFKWSEKSATISAILMLIAAFVRIFAFYGKEYSPFFTVTQIYLPYLTVAVFVFAAIRRQLTVSAFAVTLGVVFFIIKALGFDSFIHTFLCILLYILVLFLYWATVLGVIKTKLPLVLAFALPLAEHIIQDIIEICLGADITTYLPELSVLIIMSSLLIVALGLQKNNS